MNNYENYNRYEGSDRESGWWLFPLILIILIVFIGSLFIMHERKRNKKKIEPRIQSMNFNPTVTRIGTVTALMISPIVKDTAGFNIRQHCIDFMTDINYDSLVSQFKFHETPGVRFVPVKVCYPENNCTEYTFEEFKKWVNQIEQR